MTMSSAAGKEAVRRALPLPSSAKPAGSHSASPTAKLGRLRAAAGQPDSHPVALLRRAALKTVPWQLVPYKRYHSCPYPEPSGEPCPSSCLGGSGSLRIEMCNAEECIECSADLREANCPGPAVIIVEGLDACKAHAEAKEHEYLSYDAATGKCFSSASCKGPLSSEDRWERTEHPVKTRCEQPAGEGVTAVEDLDACFAMAASMGRPFAVFRTDNKQCYASETCNSPTSVGSVWTPYEHISREDWKVYTRKPNTGLEDVPVSASYPAGRSSKCTMLGG